MINAKEEFIGFVRDRKLVCATVSFEFWEGDIQSFKTHLKCNYTPEEYEEFLNKLDINYHDGYGSQHMFGTVWFLDGTWADRCDYDGAEWWEIRQRPEIPEYLFQ